MESGDFATVGEIAEDENTNLSTVGRVFVEAILAGRQPEGLTMTRAMQPSPMEWRHQISG
jgi:hypothetical protein